MLAFYCSDIWGLDICEHVLTVRIADLMLAFYCSDIWGLDICEHVLTVRIADLMLAFYCSDIWGLDICEHVLSVRIADPMLAILWHRLFGMRGAHLLSDRVFDFGLTPKAPPTFCSGRQFQILMLFQNNK